MSETRIVDIIEFVDKSSHKSKNQVTNDSFTIWDSTFRKQNQMHLQNRGRLSNRLRTLL